MLVLIGVGGAGSKVVDTFYQKTVVKKIISRIQTKVQREFSGIAVDTSKKIKNLSNIPAENAILIGKSKAKGHGTGVDVSLGKKIVTEELGLVTNALKKIVTEKPWMIILFAGLGGGTGSGGFPVIAKKVKSHYKCNILGVFMLPSSGKGRVYAKNAFENLEEVLSSVDGSIIIDNNVVTDKGEDIADAQRIVNQGIHNFFRLVDEVFLERCLNTNSTIAYSKTESEHVSIKDLIEKMLRDNVFLKFDMKKSRKMVFVARGNLNNIYGHEFAQGWTKNKFGLDLEFEFYDEPGGKSVEVGLLIVETKDLNGRFDDIGGVENKKGSSELEDLLKDIHSIY